MIQHILDTDALTLVQCGNVILRSKIRQLPVMSVGTSVITLEEQLSGWYSLLRRAKSDDQIERAYRELAECTRQLSTMPIADFDKPSINRWKQLRSLKLGVGGFDLRIAAIALEIGATLVTRNLRDFGRVPGLLVEDWSS